MAVALAAIVGQAEFGKSRIKKIKVELIERLSKETGWKD
jgi:hypothetical protein